MLSSAQEMTFLLLPSVIPAPSLSDVGFKLTLLTTARPSDADQLYF